MPTSASITIADHENEKSTVTVNVQDLGAANYGSVSQDVDYLKDAIDAICLGTVQQAVINKAYPEVAGYPSGVPAAQRENKWLVTSVDTMQFLDEANTIANPGYGKLFQNELPCADLSILPAGREELDLTTGAGATFKGVWEARARSPWNHTNGKITPPATFCTVLSIRHVGRNT